MFSVPLDCLEFDELNKCLITGSTNTLLNHKSSLVLKNIFHPKFSIVRSRIIGLNGMRQRFTRYSTHRLVSKQ